MKIKKNHHAIYVKYANEKNYKLVDIVFAAYPWNTKKYKKLSEDMYFLKRSTIKDINLVKLHETEVEEARMKLRLQRIKDL